MWFSSLNFILLQLLLYNISRTISIFLRTNFINIKLESFNLHLLLNHQMQWNRKFGCKVVNSFAIVSTMKLLFMKCFSFSRITEVSPDSWSWLNSWQCKARNNFHPPPTPEFLVEFERVESQNQNYNFSNKQRSEKKSNISTTVMWTNSKVCNIRSKKEPWW